MNGSDVAHTVIILLLLVLLLNKAWPAIAEFIKGFIEAGSGHRLE
jgi:hypothetical protein